MRSFPAVAVALLCTGLAAVPALAAERAQAPAPAASVAVEGAAASSGGELAHGAAFVLAAVAAIGFVTRRLRD